jgi:membrane-associated phospholipid phosphatase
VFRLSVSVSAAYAALAVLVATGTTNGLDEWAVDHLMPGFSHTAVVPSKLDAAVPLLHAHWDKPLDYVGNVVTLPAQAAIASVLAAVCWLVLARRGRTRAALSLAVAWIAAGGIEALCKSVLSRPLLHHDGAPLLVFQSSWPSGHTVRSFLLAATIAAAWPAAGRWVALWAAASLVLLELDGWHVPTDIAGGLLLALLAAGLARREARYEAR